MKIAVREKQALLPSPNKGVCVCYTPPATACSGSPEIMPAAEQKAKITFFKASSNFNSSRRVWHVCTRCVWWTHVYTDTQPMSSCLTPMAVKARQKERDGSHGEDTHGEDNEAMNQLNPSLLHQVSLCPQTYSMGWERLWSTAPVLGAVINQGSINSALHTSAHGLVSMQLYQELKSAQIPA